jgi:hypothetical protein
MNKLNSLLLEKDSTPSKKGQNKGMEFSKNQSAYFLVNVINLST